MSADFKPITQLSELYDFLGKPIAFYLKGPLGIGWSTHNAAKLDGAPQTAFGILQPIYSGSRLLPSLDLRSVKDTSSGEKILHGQGVIDDRRWEDCPALEDVGMMVRLATSEEIEQLNAGLASGKYGINVEHMGGWEPTQGYRLPEFQPKRGKAGLPTEASRRPDCGTGLDI